MYCMYVGYVMVCSKMVNVPKHEQLFQGFFGTPVLEKAIQTSLCLDGGSGLNFWDDSV